MPLGHLNSDLSPTACNVGLRRRKDLTLRSDVQLCDTAGSYSLKDVLGVSCCFERGSAIC